MTEETKHPLELLSLEPLEKKLSKKFGIKLNFKTVINIGLNNDKRILFNSQDLVKNSGIFAFSLKEAFIVNFGGSQIHNDVIWFDLHIYFHLKEGGQNGVKIGDAWYYIKENKWRYEFVDEKFGR